MASQCAGHRQVTDQRVRAKPLLRDVLFVADRQWPVEAQCLAAVEQILRRLGSVLGVVVVDIVEALA